MPACPTSPQQGIAETAVDLIAQVSNEGLRARCFYLNRDLAEIALGAFEIADGVRSTELAFWGGLSRDNGLKERLALLVSKSFPIPVFVEFPTYEGRAWTFRFDAVFTSSDVRSGDHGFQYAEFTLLVVGGVQVIDRREPVNRG